MRFGRYDRRSDWRLLKFDRLERVSSKPSTTFFESAGKIVSATNDTLLLFRSHECSSGLSDEALREISDAAELVQFDSDEYVHHANQTLTAVYLIVHGRLKQSAVDMHCNILLQRFLTRGSQFGALAATHSEPIPVDVVAVEPSTVLKLNFETAIGFTRKHEAFGLNLTRLLSSMVRQVTSRWSTAIQAAFLVRCIVNSSRRSELLLAERPFIQSGI